MSFSIQTNVNSLIAQENLRVNSNFQSQTIQRLTSGYRINSSGDDAAGLAIANKFRSDTSELTQGVRNANDGVSQLQIMDGGMSNIGKMLDRLKTLATQSASATFTGDRNVLNKEFGTLVTEIDRQAQAIGLDKGGSFAKSLNVYLGGGAGSSSSAIISNGTVALDLSKSTVDSASLGLTGMQAGNASYDLSTSNISAILANGSNTSDVTGHTVFKISGAGFGDGVKVDVNLSGVTNGDSLVSAINSAIQTANTTDASFKAAGVSASITADATTGKQVLSFTSSTTAFQVRAGDVKANALLGNISSGSTGSSIAATLTGNAYSGTFDNNQTINVTISAGGLSSPVTLAVQGSGTGSTGSQMADLVANAVANSSTLKAAGITASNSAGSLNFTSSTGEVMNVQVDGDYKGLLGYGNFEAAEAASITAGSAFAAPTTGGNVNLDLSLNGGSSTRLTVAVTATTETEASILSKINVAINNAGAGSDWQKAGIRAVDNGGAIELVSENGTKFRLGVSNSAATSNLGFRADGAVSVAAYTAATAATAGSSALNSNGDYQLGTSGEASNLSFTGIAYGTDSQTLTVSAADSGGGSHSMVVALNHDSASSIDQAIKSINDTIQGGSDSTLKQITAVKVNASGTEKIQFVSSLANFSVGVSATQNGTGVGSQGTTLNSTKVGSGGTLDISTADGATAAVTAIAAAVQKLGTAQAAIGKGQNQLNYAIGLAQSQISNYSAAESRIRDADVAAEAANLTKAQVLQQASMAAMAQANSAPQAVLSLLRG